MSRYTTKRALMRPVTALRRRRRAGKLNEFTLAVYEAHDYRPAMRRFFVASRGDPDILVDVDLPDGAVVVDVGAYVGEWSQRIVDRAAGQGRAVSVHAFEPEPHAMKQLRKQLGDDPRVVLHPFGLGGVDREERIAIGGPGSSVFVDPATPGFLGDIGIELRDAADVLDELGIERIDLVKINIEGGEYELLDRLHDTGWLARTRTVLVQFHEFGPDAYRGRRRNRRQLGETHQCTWCYRWVWERWDRR
jgi:FkbM family methyltransferase